MQLLKKILQAINFGYYFEDSQEVSVHSESENLLEITKLNVTQTEFRLFGYLKLVSPANGICSFIVIYFGYFDAEIGVK